MQYGRQGDMKKGQTSQQIHEPTLTYDPQTHRWSGANAQFSVWMDDETFRSYVDAWYRCSKWLPDSSPADRAAAALIHCQKVRYWFRCERNYDSRVHITYH